MDRIIRINPLLEALRSAPERVNKVFVQEEKGHARIGEVIREAKARHVPVVVRPGAAAGPGGARPPGRHGRGLAEGLCVR